jgi:Putative esterase
VRRAREQRGSASGYGSSAGLRSTSDDLKRDPIAASARPAPLAPAAANSSSRRLAHLVEPLSLVAIGTAVLLLVVSVMSGLANQSNQILVDMGFDPDRAQLILSLVLGALAASAAMAVAGRFATSTVLGLAGFATLYAGTFVGETSGALGASGATGSFDLLGWWLTLGTLAVAALVSAWAGSALAGTARRFVVARLAPPAQPAPRRVWSRGLPPKGQPIRLVAIEVTAILLLLAVMSGAMDQSNTALVVMGFDQDRAQLITSLLLGAFAASAVMLATGRFAISAVLGVAGFAVLYAGTIAGDPAGALGATGATGAIDLVGFLLTLVALAVATFVSSWAGAALAGTARPSIVAGVAAMADAAKLRRIERRALRYPLAAILAIVVAVVAVPTFGDLVNYTPDALMRQGAPQGLDQAAAQTEAPITTAGPTSVGSGASSAPTIAPNPSATPEPWQAWQPSGFGSVKNYYLKAPWNTGAGSAGITVYLPPGYDPNGSRTYPVLYEAPTAYDIWWRGTYVKPALDTLIDKGTIPAMIMVFINSDGGPFPDSECANSFDSREWFDTYVGETVVAWVDAHYHTIPRSEARAIAGMSQGGYCAAILALHHPNAFGTSISFSGYFVVGGGGGGGGSSATPFGGQQALIKADSPMTAAGQLSQELRSKLHFILVFKPDQPGYGPDGIAFGKTLADAGYSLTTIAATEPHGWPQVRDYFQPALEAWAAREIETGVF